MTMSLKVLINQEPSYLLLKVQGEYSLDAFKNLFSKIHEESKAIKTSWSTYRRSPVP
jgi:hypothetical protein